MPAPNQFTQPQTVGAEYGGKWIAWDEQNIRIVASGDTFDEVQHAAQSAGVEEAILEFVPPSDSAFIGGL
jgi:hypothetical protein